MQKTKIEWCDMTWNPITGCRHDCEYCYAKKIARRFEGIWDGDYNVKIPFAKSDSPKEVTGCEYGGLGYKYRVGNDKRGEPKLINAPYPYGFHPTLHRHRLETGLTRYIKPKNIFIGSMTDLFGKWVPDNWIKKVFEVCYKAPQHRYLFLTKNPERYYQLWDDISICIPNNFWLGATITKSTDRYFYSLDRMQNSFLSIEPLHENLEGIDNIPYHRFVDWCIIGAETSNRKNKIIPERIWIENIVSECRQRKVPVFMKSSLKKIWGEKLIQEYPWGKE